MRFGDLQQHIRKGATLLTPNQRSARLWRNRLVLADSQLSPSAMPWTAWAESQWQTCLLTGKDDRALLNRFQNEHLWAQVLHADQPDTLRPVRSMVRLCTQAQYLLHSYGGMQQMLDYRGDPGTDLAIFAGWLRSHTHHCTRERLLPDFALDEALVALLTPSQPIGALVLLGFDTLLPVQQRLIDVFRNAGTSVLQVDASTAAEIVPTPATVQRCTDSAHEWGTLAHALLSELAAGTGTIAVILPDPAVSRAALERTFRAELEQPIGTPVETPWEFSSGQPLSTLPLTADALSLLHWISRPLPTSAIGPLLRSPYFDLQLGSEHAGELDANILRAPGRLRPEWSMADLAAACHEPGLHTSLLRILQTAKDFRGPRSVSAWVEAVPQLLHAAGWPGTRERTTSEFQLVDRWTDLLDGFSSLGIFGQTFGFRDFLDLLQAGAEDISFAPENTGAPIQVISPHEAAGSTADLLWFAGADESHWNARQHPSPLLPWSLQAAHGMPGIDPARDAADHLRLTERLARSAPRAAFSYSATNADGDLRPAPVLGQIGAMAAVVAPPCQPNDQSPALESYADETAPPFTMAGTVPGGVGVLQSQALCAFRAFAERRLYSTSPESPDFGYSPRERGDLLHKVLEKFWAATHTHTELLRLRTTGALDGTLQHHIDAVLPPANGPWNGAYIAVQRSRLHSLLRRWLEYEAKRPPFTVLHTERSVPGVAVGPLRFDLRVDRVDEVESGGDRTRALIDYKSGSANKAQWQTDRPEAPQLPLYAVAAGIEHVGAIAFATVKAGDKTLGLQAVADDPTALVPTGTRARGEDFETLLSEWHTVMEHLSQQFAAGDARVGPKQYPTTCTHCGQRMLCRLDSETLTALADEVEEGAPAE